MNYLIALLTIACLLLGIITFYASRMEKVLMLIKRLKSEVHVELMDIKKVLGTANLYLSEIDTAITDLNQSLRVEDEPVDEAKAILQQRLDSAAQELADYESNRG